MSDYRPGWRLIGFDPRGSAAGKLPVRREEKMKVVRTLFYGGALYAAYSFARFIERTDTAALIKGNSLAVCTFVAVGAALCMLISLMTGGME